MATSFKFRYSASIIPTEEVTLDDGTDISYNINSNLDKTFGSSYTKTIGTVSSKVVTDTYLTTTSPVALSHSTILNSGVGLAFLFIKIVSAGSSGTPDLILKVNSQDPVTYGYVAALSGVGDFYLSPMIYDPDNIEIYSSGATTVANIEILVGTV